jgi:hypothetical protein
VRVLTVDVDEELARRLQLREGGAVAVDEAARAAGAIDGAPEDEPSGVAGKFVFFHPRDELAVRVQFEFCRKLRPLGTFAYHAGIGTAADQQLDRIHQHGLAGAGLPGQHREPLFELEARGLHEDEVADLERAQHRYSRPLSSTSLQRSFSRSVAK